MKSEKEFFKNLESVQPDQYQNLDLDRLMLYTVYKLNESNIETTYDNVVIAAFKLFPKRFSLIGFPDYPDGKRVNDALLHCIYKTKKWLAGNAKSGYAITKKGEYFLEETKKILKGEIKLTEKKEDKAKRKEVYFISLLKDTSAYRKFITDRETEIQENEIWDSLRCDKSTSAEVLRQHFDSYLNYADKIEDSEVINFLNYLKEKWPKLFSDNDNKHGQ